MLSGVESLWWIIGLRFFLPCHLNAGSLSVSESSASEKLPKDSGPLTHLTNTPPPAPEGASNATQRIPGAEAPRQGLWRPRAFRFRLVFGLLGRKEERSNGRTGPDEQRNNAPALVVRCG